MNLSNYKAIILAGGKGTRLYPITKEIPKPLLLIKGKPIINYLVDLFIDHKIKEIAILINKNYKNDFQWWKKRYYPKNKIRLVEEEKELGTFGGLYLLKSWIANNKFFLTNGDELKKIDLSKMAKLHNQAGTLGTIALVEIEDPENYGVVVCNSTKIQDFIEKPKNPPCKYINAGLYLLNSEILELSKLEFSMIEKDIFPQLAKENKLAGFKFKGQWTDCGTWKRYQQALSDWQ